MRRLTILVALALVSAVAATEAAKPTSKPAKPTIAKTQPPKGGAPKASTVKGSTLKGASMKGSTVKGASMKGSTVKVTGAHANASSGKAVKPAKADAKVAKAHVTTAKVETRSAKAEHKTNKKATESSHTASGGTTSPRSNTDVSTNSIDFTTTAVGQKLEKNSALRSKIEAKLQAAGYTGSVYEAAYGYKNLGQFNAATNQVQNQGYSFELLKVLMTGTYVDPETHLVYRANRLPDGTVNLVRSDLATNPTSALSLGQSKQAIAAGAEMPDIARVGSNTTTGSNRTSATSSASSVKSKTKRKTAVSTVQPGGGSF
jgi:hypothetical protein